jgi:hypothetical protein
MPLIIIKGNACNNLSLGSWVLNCKKIIDKARAKKEGKSPYQANAKQDKTDVTTKIKCNLLVNFSWKK